MQEMHLVESAVIRVVPRVEREEFINVGVILLCKKVGFLKAICWLNVAKLMALYNDADIEQISANLNSLEKIAAGEKDCGSPIARLQPAERFRWLTAVRSTVIQTSRPHPALVVDPEATLQRLLAELVL